MPTLRFIRDKRGYETTLLVHAVRRDGRSRERILYWFRTPPGVRVGRPALDEDAIRWIEDQNPDIEFDWQKILEAKAPPAPAPEDARAHRARRDRNERRKTAAARKPAASNPEPGVRNLEPGTRNPEPATLNPEPVVAEALEQLTHPDTEETVEPPPAPLDKAFGPEQLTRLRARYAELQARITERGGDPDRILALRAQAEQLNPDVWVTDEEIRQGVASFEPRIRELRAALGLRSRRRSRRGGRRRSATEPRPPD